MKRLFSLIAIFTLWLGIQTPHAFAAFSFERSITIDHTKVSSADQSNFPILVASTTYSFLETAGNGGKVQNGEGFDIGFYSDSACTSKLSWETERYTPTTGDVIYWVSVPTVSHSSDTVVYVCYGDSSVTTDQSATTTVWSNDGNYKLVYHLGNGTSLSLSDSTSNANTGTNGGAVATSSQIGTGASFSHGSSQYIQLGSNVTISGPFTVSGWYKYYSASFTQILVGGEFGNTNRIPGICCTTKYVVTASSSDQASASLGTAGVWNYFSLERDSSNLWTISTNGAAGVSLFSGAAKGELLGVQYLAKDITGESLDGGLGEVHLASINRSAGWVTTEYNNQLLPDKAGGATGFYTLGAETPLSTGTVSPKLVISGFLSILNGFLSI